MGDNKEGEDWLVDFGYQLLTPVRGNETEFEDSAVFWGVLHIAEGGQFQIIEDPSLVGLGY